MAPQIAQARQAGAPLGLSGQQVAYWREDPHEVDAVLDGTWGTWALEVKTGRFSARDLRGLFEFTRRHPRFRPIVACDAAAIETARHAGAHAVRWGAVLLGGPSAATPPA